MKNTSLLRVKTFVKPKGFLILNIAGSWPENLHFILKDQKNGEKDATHQLNEQMGRRQFLESSSGFVDTGRESLWFLRKTLDISSEVS